MASAAATGLLLLLLLAPQLGQAKTVCTIFKNKCTIAGYDLAIATQQGNSHVANGWWPLPPGEETEVCYDVDDWAAGTVSYYFTSKMRPDFERASSVVPSKLARWSGSTWAQGDYCIRKNGAFTFEDAHSRTCDGDGEQRVTFFRTVAAASVNIISCSVCTKIVNRCPDEYDIMFASPAVDANTNKFRIQSWLRVPGNDERTFCWVTQPGTAEDHVAMHFEAASNVATTESIVEPLYTVNWPGTNSGKAALCVNFKNTALATTASCNGINEMKMNLWYMKRPSTFTIEHCSSQSTTEQAAPQPRMQEQVQDQDEQEEEQEQEKDEQEYWVRYMPSSTGTECLDLGLARTYPLVNPRRTSTAVDVCDKYVRVIIMPNCWTEVHIEDGNVLRQVYFVPGVPSKWRGKFVFIQDELGHKASWPNRLNVPQLPDVDVECFLDGVRVGDWRYTLGGWGA